MPSDRMTLALFFLRDSTGVKLGLHNRDTVCELCLGGGINYNYTIKWLKGLHYSHFRGWGRIFFDWAVDWAYMHKTLDLFISCTLHILVFCLSDNTCTVCSWTSIQRCFNYFLDQWKAALSPLACSLDLSVYDQRGMAPVLFTGAEMQKHDSVFRHIKSLFLGIKLFMSWNVMCLYPLETLHGGGFALYGGAVVTDFFMPQVAATVRQLHL